MSMLTMFVALLASISTGSNAAVSAVAPGDSSQIELMKAHYAAVEEELLRCGPAGLTPEQCARRAQLIEVLRAYRERGVFGRNVDRPGVRLPMFVDHDGRRCAVAELLHATGDDALVDAVHERRNDAWVVDLANEREFREWLNANGLTIEEAARIQMPGSHKKFGPPSPPMQTAQPSPSSSQPSPAATGSAGSRGESASGPSNSGPSAPSPTGAGTGAPFDPRSIATQSAEEFGDWASWWEFNKLEYLKPNPLSLWSFPATGDHAREGFEAQLEAMRKSIAPAFAGMLEHDDSRVRGAAAVALGRIGGDAAVDRLRALLGDPNVDVRHHAILALGATESARAAELLRGIAERGTVSPDSKSRISRSASALAIVALGLQRRSFDDSRLEEAAALDATVVKLARSRRAEDANLVEEAAFMYGTLSPCAEIEALALEVLQRPNGDPSARARAVECLRTTREHETLSKLQHLLSGARLDLKRSAALAIGGIADPMALPPLMTAYEMESEPLTKSFLLISIGKQGGESARAFLLKEIEHGDSMQRRWCALALGILSHASGDAAVADAIRAASAREKSHDAQAAYWIAAGLARDAKALLSVRTALTSAKDPRQRMYAATALALMGGDDALAILRERRAADESALVQVAIAQALGSLGRSSDAAGLIDTLAHLRDPDLEGLAAVAMAFHGSSEALRGLSELVRLESGSNARRAAAIDGLGMLLGKRAPLSLSEISRSSNFTLFADFESDLFQVSL
jgi:HEAT repeat protein